MNRKQVYLIILVLIITPLQVGNARLRNEMPPNLISFQNTVQRQADKYPDFFHLEAPTEAFIALTFDDGPHAHNTPLILDILKAEGIKATFFVVGEQVRQYPKVAQRIVAEGHQIANHSWSHPDLRKVTDQAILEKQLEPTSSLVEELTGVFPKFIRPPYGALRDGTIEFLGTQGWQIINWSIDSFDWDPQENSVIAIVEKVKRYHHPGAIILMHCNGANTVQTLPEVIDSLRDLGYQFKTVEELFTSHDSDAE